MPRHWTLVTLLLAAGLAAPRAAQGDVDEAAAAAEGIHKHAGKRLILFTDLPSGPDVDDLVESFDQAFPQWCAYFGVDPASQADWRVTGFVMKDKARFVRTGLLPADLPPFAHGYSRKHTLWLYEQASVYYRRHLLLHEGTHSFMYTVLGGYGPPWYMEGMAELLSTHRWADRRLMLNDFPAERDDVPMWGRIKFLKEGYAARRAKSFAAVMAFRPEAHLQTETYAWCWAAAVLLDRHPRYQERFRKLHHWVRQKDFNQRFRELMGDDFDKLQEEWQLFIANVEYGYDIPGMAIDFTPGKPLDRQGAEVAVAAAAGWQNSGLRLEGGKTYALSASGRYQIAAGPPPWPCEPGGVSIRYYQGRPLGELLAAVRPDKPSPTSGLLEGAPIGLGAPLTPEQSGTLYLRVNDSAAKLKEHSGSLRVEIAPAGD